MLEVLGDCGQLIAAPRESGLAERPASGGPATLYAPNNPAFARLAADALAASRAARTRLARVLARHILPTRCTGDDLMNAPLRSRIPTLGPDSMVVDHDTGGRKVDLDLVRVTDIVAVNGLIRTVRALRLAP